MSDKYVTNTDKNTTVIVANRGVPAGKTAAIPAKELEAWLKKGGHRLVDNGTLTVSDSKDVVGVAVVEAPVIETTPAATPVVERETFDGKDPAEAVTEPESRPDLETPSNPDAGTPDEPTETKTETEEKTEAAAEDKTEDKDEDKAGKKGGKKGSK